jgi:hypothetical protein
MTPPGQLSNYIIIANKWDADNPAFSTLHGGKPSLSVMVPWLFILK